MPKSSKCLRFDDELWADMMQRAAANGMSMTAWIQQAIIEKARRDDAEMGRLVAKSEANRSERKKSRVKAKAK